jgi:CRISPR-associated protein Cas2
MLILVSYDIPDDRRRVKIAKTLEDFGERVQYSVFECDLEQEHLERLQRRLEKLVTEEEDSVRFYLLCARCENSVEVLGRGEVPGEPPDVYIV